MRSGENASDFDLAKTIAGIDEIDLSTTDGAMQLQAANPELLEALSTDIGH